MITQTEDSQYFSTLNAESQKIKRREHFKQKMNRVWFSSSSRCEKSSMSKKDGDERQRRHYWRRWRNQSESNECTESVQQQETTEETASHSDSCFSTPPVNDNLSAHADDEKASSLTSHDSNFVNLQKSAEHEQEGLFEEVNAETNTCVTASSKSSKTHEATPSASPVSRVDGLDQEEGLVEEVKAETNTCVTASSKSSKTHEARPSAGLVSRVDGLDKSWKKQKVHQRPEPGSKTWENMEEETWVARLLKDYCPLRFRKNKFSNYDSEQFKDDQTFIMFKTLIEQEDREDDQKIVHHQVHNTSKSWFRRWFHFEKDEDILWELTSIHREDPYLYFKGIKPALRKHAFRRWMNFERDRMIASEGLLFHWSKDEKFIPRLKRANLKRLDKLEKYRFLEQLFNGPRQKFPPLSFFTAQIAKKIRFDREPQVPLPKGVPPERTISTHPYFKIQKRKVKRWFKDILLKI